MARPRIEIDKEDFEKLCGLFCTLCEIAGFFDCSEDTIERWCNRTYGESFAETWKKKSSKGKISLRRNQFKLSQKNAGMAMFLGKNYLGQRDDFVESEEDTEKMLKGVREALGEIQSVID